MNSRKQATIEKYLSRYAEPEINNLQELSRYQYQHCIVIPAYNESTSFLQRLFHSKFNSSCSSHEDLTHERATTKNKSILFLAIIIVNCPDDASPVAVETTKDNIKFINEYSDELWRYKNISLHAELKNRLHLLVVDRIQQPIPKKQGVGLARKIGADIACYYYIHQKLLSPWIHSTDSDTTLPEDYFQPVTTNAAALLYPFKHQKSLDEDTLQTTHIYHLLYECRLFHYQLGLQYAQSPYAFQTVGSSLAINILNYAMVRGFPKRNAGEDFYLLNKLVKTAPIISLTKPIITIDSRISSRNPFGTGPAVSALIAENQLLSAPIFYHPHCFKLLKKFISLFDEFSSNQQLSWRATVEKHIIQPEECQSIIGAASAIQFEKALVHGYQQFKPGNPQSALKIRHHLNIWFDGFRTLKWIHFIKNNGYNKVDIFQAYSENIYPSAAVELGLNTPTNTNIMNMKNTKLKDLDLADENLVDIENTLNCWLSTVRSYLYEKEKHHSIYGDNCNSH